MDELEIIKALQHQIDNELMNDDDHLKIENVRNAVACILSILRKQYVERVDG